MPDTTSISGPLNQFLRCFRTSLEKEKLILTLRTEIISHTFARCYGYHYEPRCSSRFNGYAAGLEFLILIPVGERSFLFSRTSRGLLEPNLPPIQEEVRGGGISHGVKRPGPEFDHLSPSSAEVKSNWSYTSDSPIRLHRVDREKFNFKWI